MAPPPVAIILTLLMLLPAVLPSASAEQSAREESFASSVDECHPNCARDGRATNEDFHPLGGVVSTYQQGDELLITRMTPVDGKVDFSTVDDYAATSPVESKLRPYFAKYAADDALHVAVAAAAGDVDGDGKEDIITVDLKSVTERSGWGTYQNIFPVLTVHSPDGTRLASERLNFNIPGSHFFSFSIAAGDLDGDGRAEIVVNGIKALNLFQWEGPPGVAGRLVYRANIAPGGYDQKEHREFSHAAFVKRPDGRSDLAVASTFIHVGEVQGSKLYWERPVSGSGQFIWSEVTIHEAEFEARKGDPLGGSLAFKTFREVRHINAYELGAVRKAPVNQVEKWGEPNLVSHMEGMSGSFHVRLLPADYEGRGYDQLAIASEMFPRTPDKFCPLATSEVPTQCWVGDWNFDHEDMHKDQKPNEWRGGEYGNRVVDKFSSHTQVFDFDPQAGYAGDKSSGAVVGCSLTTRIRDDAWGREIRSGQVPGRDRPLIAAADLDGDRRAEIACANSIVTNDVKVLVYGEYPEFPQREHLQIRAPACKDSCRPEGDFSQSDHSIAAFALAHLDHSPSGAARPVVLWAREWEGWPPGAGFFDSSTTERTHDLSVHHFVPGRKNVDGTEVKDQWENAKTFAGTSWDFRLHLDDVQGVNGIAIIPFDQHGDSVKVRYTGRHEAGLARPDVIAVIAPPPYVEGIGQGPGSVSFGISKESCTGSETVTAKSVGWQAGVSGEVSVPLAAVRVLEFEAVYTGERTTTESEGKEVCTSQDIAWTSQGDEWGIVSRQTPFDTYEYVVVGSPRAQEVGKSVFVIMSGKPVVYMWPLSVYNEALSKYARLNPDSGARPLDASDLGTTIIAGDPRTYPSRTDRDRILEGARAAFNTQGESWSAGENVFQLSKSEQAKLLASEEHLFSFNSTLATVGSQSGSVSVGVGRSATTSEGKSIEIGHGFDASVSTGAFNVGASFVHMTGESHTLSFSSSRSFEAEVPSITHQPFFQKYGYSWGLFMYPQKVDLSTPTVLNFWVENYKGHAPPAPVAEAPEVLQPATGTYQAFRNATTFEWATVPNARLYELNIEQLGETLTPFALRRLVWANASDPTLSAEVAGLPADASFQWTVTAYDEAAAAHTDARDSYTHAAASPARFGLVGKLGDSPTIVVTDRHDEVGPNGNVIYSILWAPTAAYSPKDAARPTFEFAATRSASPPASGERIDALSTTRELEPGTWYLHVRETNAAGHGPWSAPRKMEAAASPVLAGFKASPQRGGTLTFPLSWDLHTGATAYEIEVRPAEGVAEEPAATTATSWTPPTPMAPGEYEVRVRVVGGDIRGAYSAPLTVLVKPAPRSSPVLNATLVDRSTEIAGETIRVDFYSVPINWTAIELADGYEVQVSATRQFAALTHEENVSAPVWTTEILAGGEHWVRVRAMNGASPGPWSEPMALFVEPQSTNVPSPGVGWGMLVILLCALATARRRN